MNKNEYGYLSDEELMQLIEDTEQNALFAAPPDMILDVLDKIEASEEPVCDKKVIEFSERSVNDKPAGKKDGKSLKANKTAEYRQFCIKVIAGAAAAIALIIVAPIITPRSSEQFVGKITSSSTEEEPMSKDEALKEMNTPSKSEVIGDEVIPTKEEKLNKTGITEHIRNSHVISDMYEKSNS